VGWVEVRIAGVKDRTDIRVAVEDAQRPTAWLRIEIAAIHPEQSADRETCEQKPTARFPHEISFLRCQFPCTFFLSDGSRIFSTWAEQYAPAH
jgi:hypothetical protein